MQESKSETSELNALFDKFSTPHKDYASFNTCIKNDKALSAVYLADEQISAGLGTDTIPAGGCYVAFQSSIHKLIDSKTLGEHPLFFSVCGQLKNTYFSFISSRLVKNAKDGVLSELRRKIEGELAIFDIREDPGAYVVIWKQSNEVFTLGEDFVSSPRLVRWKKFVDGVFSEPQQI